MRVMKRALVIMAIMSMLVAVGCSRKERVGTEELLDIEEEKQRERLGQILKSPDPTEPAPSAAAIGGPSPDTQQQQQEEQQEQNQEIVELFLISEHPYYEPNPNMQVRVGSTLRITNRDDKVRRYQSQDGTYDSGPIDPGGTVDVVCDVAGDFTIADENVPFATAFLQVF
jgi:hypothetical protein